MLDSSMPEVYKIIDVAYRCGVPANSALLPSQRIFSSALGHISETGSKPGCKANISQLQCPTQVPGIVQ